MQDLTQIRFRYINTMEPCQGTVLNIYVNLHDTNYMHVRIHTYTHAWIQIYILQHM